MNAYLDDPVLNLTASTIRLLRWLCLGFVALMFLILALSGFAALVTAGDVFKSTKEPSEFFLIMGVGGVYFYIVAQFFKLLRDIILSTGSGQPLTLDNGRRLKSMGWLYLAILFGDILLAFGYPFLDSSPFFNEEHLAYLIEEGVSATIQLLIPATLFILARVFEQGARMQEELEGTV